MEEKPLCYALTVELGKFSIIRAAQLLDFIKKNTSQYYSYFLSGNYSTVASMKGRQDYAILSSLTQLNLKNGSYVGGIDLMKEEANLGDSAGKDYIRINPFAQDNNDGFLVIDVIEGNEEPQIKYCFDMCNDKFAPISANRYYEEYEESELENYSEWDAEDIAYYQSFEKALAFVETFELLTVSELEEFFNKKYLKEKNFVD